MSTSISTTLTACLKSFDQLKARAEQPDYRHEEEVPLISCTAESDRLEMWTLNVEALQTGQSSLESRLGNSLTSQEVSKGVAKLLEDLDSFLTEMLQELSKAGPSASDDDASLGTSIEQTTEGDKVIKALHMPVCVASGWGKSSPPFRLLSPQGLKEGCRLAT